jgi:hypothetical protein
MEVYGIWDGVQDLNNEDISPQITAMQKDLEDALIHGMVRSLERLGQCNVALRPQCNQCPIPVHISLSIHASSLLVFFALVRLVRQYFRLLAKHASVIYSLLSILSDDREQLS